MPEVAKGALVPRGRGRAAAKKRRAASADDDESAYTESGESAFEDSGDDSVQSVESEEYDSQSDDGEYSEEEAYVRPSRRSHHAGPQGGAPNMSGPGSGFYQWNPAAGGQPMMMPPGMMHPGMMGMRPLMPMLAPRSTGMPNAAFPAVVRAMNPTAGQQQQMRPTLTASQLQDIANSTIASLLAGGSPAMPTAPLVTKPEVVAVGEKAKVEGTKLEGETQLEVKPEGETAPSGLPPSDPTADQIKASVSDEIKQNLARMLSDPGHRAMLMQRLYAQQMAKMQQEGGQQPPPNIMMRPPMMPGQMPMMYRPMYPMGYPLPQQQQHLKPQPSKKQKQKERRVRERMKYDGAEDDDVPIASRRATRSAAKKVDFSRMYEEEEAVEAEIEGYAEGQGSDEEGATGKAKPLPKKVHYTLEGAAL